ncbi:hypothetical protein K492DRAFT_132847 [Lichtheimia hyalospora FSU 10163]|nr:hypothetical protein K492DRAFT_132847 [Lichtheimia hyalospora FSU 10163]
MDQDTESEEKRQCRNGSPAGTLPTVNEAHRRKKSSSRSSAQPRWHNQAYMLFLALRESPNRSLPRKQLIDGALEMDKRISRDRGLPKVFKGKTPANSASASLTTNTDRLFIPFKPEGSRSTHFKLAYEPGNFQGAVEEYRKWERKLVDHDWPFCFGVLKKKPENEPPKENQDGMACSLRAPMDGLSQPQSTQPTGTVDNTKDAMDTDSTTSHDPVPTAAAATAPGSSSLATSAQPATNHNQDNKSTEPVVPEVTLEDLDLSNVPKTWRDILRVGDSTIPNAGKGLFATRKLPHNTPIGFYFGVPMTEDEYDSLKDRVGRASEYSIMYRRTVLDATDSQGQPFTDPEGEMYCPFHFMNESTEKQSNILFIEGAVVNQVICWTKRDIEPGEELFVWYGSDVERHWNAPPTSSPRKKVHTSSPLPSCTNNNTPPPSSSPSPTA